MRNAGGYVRVYRSMLDWEWYDDDACVRLMLHLILSVNWEPKEWHGQLIAPGQLVTSMDGIAGKLRLSRSAIRRAMDKLKSTGEVTVKTNNHWTTVTLANWAEFQEVQPTNGRQTRKQPTDHRPTIDRPAATTEEGNKGNIETLKKEEAVAPFTSEAFLKAWETWEASRREARKPIGPTARKLQYAKLASMGEARAIIALLHSAEKEYQGIYEPNAGRIAPEHTASRERGDLKTTFD